MTEAVSPFVLPTRCKHRVYITSRIDNRILPFIGINNDDALLTLVHCIAPSRWKGDNTMIRIKYNTEFPNAVIIMSFDGCHKSV